ncbi:MAG: PAAR domain-containing protein [Polyangiaceae bacterium]|nr:PAAR domain-containing protein [Polyangiaceae bacterium]
MPPAARKTDLTVHGGAIVEGSPNVSIGYLPAARLLDKHVCPIHGPGPITQSSVTVYINGMGAARMGDACTCMIPSTAAGGGSNEKGEPTKFAIGREKKFGEKTKEWEKEGKEPWKEKPPEKPTPKISAELSREFGKIGNADQKKGAFETGVWEGKGTARAGVEAELGNLRNAKADVGAKYEIEGTAVKAQGQLGNVEQGSVAEAKGEARFLTAKAGAQGGAALELKDGKVQQAYVGGEAGIGGSVVEGKIEGKTKAFKLPFINWGISFNGEASGALLTAEAKATAMAGYKDGKWTFGFGAKLGAAIAGLGFKFGFSIERLDPPEKAKPTPNVPGFAGIDPIAKGCFTVLVGGMPPPYIPGPPQKADYGGKVIGGPGNRNKAEALELKPDPVEDRRIQNKQLAMQIMPDGLTKLEHDAKKVGVTMQQIALMQAGKCPLSFKSVEQFEEFKKELNELTKAIGLGDAVLRMKGTSTTFYSENPGKPLGHHFDANPNELADVDIGLESKTLTEQMAAAGVSPNPKIPSIFKTKDVMKSHPKLQAFSQKWTQKLGRDVNFVGLVDPSNPPAAPTDYLL